MKEQNPPEKLIKFYAFNKYNCDALINNYLWASNPADFNDPFDSSIFMLNENTFTKDWLLRTTNCWSHEWWTDDKIQNRDKYFNFCLKIIGIVCLNENKSNNQDLLWGYYTNQKGFAVEFKEKILSESLGINPIKINYRNPENFKSFFIDDESTEYFDIIKEWIRQKKRIWKNETEWRFIFTDLFAEPSNFLTKPETRKKKYNSEAIETVYLGYQFFDKRNLVMQWDGQIIYILCDKDRLQNSLLSYLAFPSTIKVKHMRLKNNEFRLFPRECRIRKQDEGRFEIEYLE